MTHRFSPSVYASWQTRLFREHGWPPEHTLPFTLALACVCGLMLQSDSHELEFSLAKNGRTENEEWHVQFELLPNPKPDQESESPTFHWRTCFDDMWLAMVAQPSERSLEILGGVLLEHLPQQVIGEGVFDFPGVRMRWRQENLTSSELLKHILNTTSLNV